MEFLHKLIGALGPSGKEDSVRSLIYREIKEHVDEVYVDKFGNLVAHKKGKGPKVMLAAHMDEVGLVVKYIHTNGRIHCSTLGGLEPMALIGQRVSFLDDANKEICQGVISTIDLSEDRDVSNAPTLEDLFIDIGLDKEGILKLGIEIGTFVALNIEAKTLGSDKIVSGKALDDRVGCYVMVEVAKKLKKSKNGNIFYVFTVQEEVGLYGAKISVYNINPDWGIAVDTTNSEDMGDHPRIVLGQGPCITVKDSEMISNLCLNSWLKEIAEKEDIPIQFKVEDFGTTDATRIMLSRGGIPSTVLAVALRNIHSTISIAHVDDIKNSIKLLYELLKNPPNRCIV